MNWKNDITKALNLEYPIVQAPMFGVGTPEMVAATAKMGGLGSLPLGDLSPEHCVALIRGTRKLTNKPFAVNIFVNEIPPLTEDLRNQYHKARVFIEKIASDHGLKVKLPGIESFKLTDYKEQIDALISEKCKIVSFTFGNLDAQSIQRFKQNDTILIGTCTSIEEALILEQSGIDILCVQGFEAGGHRGSFVSDPIPQTGGFSLLPQVYDAVKIPLIYGGGIYNGKTLLASRILGAQGFQVGSLLLCSRESTLLDFEKDSLKSAGEDQVVLTKSFSGRYARGLNNAFIKAIEKSEYILPYPYQNKLTAELRKQAKKSENIDFVSVWTGNSLSSFSDASTTEILLDLIAETNNIFHLS
jgi:nitronate monooxygenase